MDSSSSAAGAQKLTRDQQRLAERHLYLVKVVARPVRRRYPACLGSEISALAAQGLVEATRTYDGACDEAFPRFARPRMRRFVMHELRRASVAANDVVIEVPVERGEAASDAEAAATDDYTDRMLGVATGAASRQAARGPEEELTAREARGRVLAALEAARADLPPRAQEVVRLHYDEQLKMAEIAARLGIGRATVERIHSATLPKLLARLASRGVTGGSWVAGISGE